MCVILQHRGCGLYEFNRGNLNRELCGMARHVSPALFKQEAGNGVNRSAGLTAAVDD